MKNKNKRRRELRNKLTVAQKKELSKLNIYNRCIRRDKIRILDTGNKIKKGGKCSICGYNNLLIALIWHHPKDSLKEYTIADLISQACINKYKKEVKKCTLICANCHLILHNE